MSLKNRNNIEIIGEDKVFDRRKVTIKSRSLIDNESMFYNPYKKSVGYKSANGSKVVSKKYVI